MFERSGLNDCQQCVHPLFVASAQFSDRPIATKDDSIWTKAIEAVINDGSEVFGFETFGGSRDDSGNLASDIGLFGQASKVFLPLFYFVRCLLASFGESSECFWIRVAAMIEYELCVLAAFGQFAGVGEFGWTHAEVVG